jgi:hypothetical protein
VHVSNTQTRPCQNSPSLHVRPYFNPIQQALASLGGSILDGNRTFRSLANRTKEDLESETIFSFVADADLPASFEHISTMITKMGKPDQQEQPIWLAADFTHRPDLRLQVTLVRISGIMKFLCITLMQNSHQACATLETTNPTPRFFTKFSIGSIGDGHSKNADTSCFSREDECSAFSVVG